MVFSQPTGKNKQSPFGTSDDKKGQGPTFRLAPKDPPPSPSMPSADDLIASSRVVALPMRTPFRGITVREAVVFQGPAGWGEFAPFVEYADAEARLWLAAGIEAAYLGPPAPVREHVEVNATVPAVPADEVAEIISRFPGAKTVKVKVAEAGQSLADDVERVAAARELVPNVRIDANGAWEVATAIESIRAIGDVEYVEQPCRTVEELAEVRRSVSVPIAADESIRRSGDPLRVARADAADIAVLKVAPLGGMRSVLKLAERLPMQVVISSALDTAVGMSAGVAAAAALPHLDRACGLGTGALFTRDVAPPFRAVDGLVGPRAVVPGDDVPAAAPDRVRWWEERLRRAHALLVG